MICIKECDKIYDYNDYIYDIKKQNKKLERKKVIYSAYMFHFFFHIALLLTHSNIIWSYKDSHFSLIFTTTYGYADKFTFIFLASSKRFVYTFFLNWWWLKDDGRNVWFYKEL